MLFRSPSQPPLIAAAIEKRLLQTLQMMRLEEESFVPVNGCGHGVMLKKKRLPAGSRTARSGNQIPGASDADVGDFLCDHSAVEFVKNLFLHHPQPRAQTDGPSCFV